MKNLQGYSICDKLPIDMTGFGETTSTVSGRKFSIEVIDAISSYVDTIKDMFDFKLIKEYVRQHLKVLINCCNGGNSKLFM